MVMPPSQEQSANVIKSTILIGRKYLLNYITQSSYCIIEISRSFLKKNIETKDSCKFDKIIKESL